MGQVSGESRSCCMHATRNTYTTRSTYNRTVPTPATFITNNPSSSPARPSSPQNGDGTLRMCSLFFWLELQLQRANAPHRATSSLAWSCAPMRRSSTAFGTPP